MKVLPTRPPRLAPLCASLAALSACGPRAATPDALHLGGASMGTSWSVELVEPPAAVREDALQAELQALLDELEGRMTSWRAESEVRRFSDGRSLAWTPVSRDTARVVAEALRIGAATDGAFDVTVAPLVELWGFGPAGAGAGTAAPAAAELEEAHARVGSDALEVRLDPPALRKARPGLALDLSGIAKGHAVDRLAERLEELGVERYLVELGGELRVRGRSATGAPWRVGVEHPREPGRLVLRRLALERDAVATSGDYRRARRIDGQRAAHVIDPRTGRAHEGRLASVTVVADSACTADALATGLMVLGATEGAALARREGWAALFVIDEGGALRERWTPAFERWLEP